MKLTTISTTYERKINLGNYRSAHIGITLWADLAEEDDLDECAKALWTMATENVRYKASQIKNGKDPDPDPCDKTHCGQPHEQHPLTIP